MPNYISKKDLQAGKRFVKICKHLFPGCSRRDIAEKMGLANEGRVRLFEEGSMPDALVLNFLDRQGYSIEWLLLNKGEMLMAKEAGTQPLSPSSKNQGFGSQRPEHNLPPGSRRMNVHRKDPGKEWWESNVQDWEVRGLVAGTAHNGAVSDDRGYAEETVTPPEGLTLVPVVGDSMAPLLLAGQEAMIDKTQEGAEIDNAIHVVVVTSEDGDEECFVKRLQKNGDEYILSSLNIDGGNNPPFTVRKDTCRVWPVIGVWFAGKGKILRHAVKSPPEASGDHIFATEDFNQLATRFYAAMGKLMAEGHRLMAHHDRAQVEALIDVMESTYRNILSKDAASDTSQDAG